MPELTVLQPTLAPPSRPPSRGLGRLRGGSTRLYRLAVVVGIAWVVHANAVYRRAQADAPIRLEEVKPLLPAASRIEPDPSERRGLFVLDETGRRVGYALRTSPQSDSIKGYAGPTDTLIVLNDQMKVAGIRIRSTHDTREHVYEMVAIDDAFMTKWDGLNWDEVAAKQARVGWDDVPGASLSSMAIAQSIQQRFALAKQAIEAPPPSVRWAAHDIGTIAVLLVACGFAFTRLRSKLWLRRLFQIVLIVYLGYFNGQLLSQSLMAGWSASGVAWRQAPGLALLLAAALVLPWLTRRQVYCSHVCPHGAAQELVGRWSPWRLPLHRGVDRGLRWLPPMLLALVLIVTLFGLSIDPANLEPFVAYQIHTATWIIFAIFVAGLVAAAFVPMAYCKYGCPTGLVLSFVRSHGKADGFGRQDFVAGLLLAMVYVMHTRHEWIQQWILSNDRW